MTALLGFVTWTVVGRALRPVESIRAEVADISDSNLSRRVPEPPGGDEIAQLARTMNAMLDRLEAASRRQRAFAADASHELQSPLTRLRTHLEVAMSHPATTDWEALAGDLWSDGAEMERLVRDLLFLARDDERPGEESPHDLVDLDDVVLEEVARIRVGSRVPVETAGVSAAPVRGSREQLVRLVRNLLENAERHARTRVEVSVCADHDGVELHGHRRRAGRPGRAPGRGSSRGSSGWTMPGPETAAVAAASGSRSSPRSPRGTAAPAGRPTARPGRRSCSGCPPSSTEASLHPVGLHLG